MKKDLIIATAMALLLQVAQLRAQQTNQTDIPRSISYQGMISQNGSPAQGTVGITVSIYADASGTNKLWSQTFSANVSNGIFNLMLGSAENPLPSPQVLDRSLWLGVQVNGDEFQSIVPLSTTAYALNVADSAITTPKIADRAITSSKIADHSISWNKMGTDYIPYLRVNGAKISSGQNSINFTGSDGLKIDYDSTTLSLVIHPDSDLTNIVEAKGSNPLSITAWEDGGTGEANTTSSGTFVIGDNSNQASNVYFGGGISAPAGDGGNSWTLHGENGNGTDQAGGSINIAAGKSTGSGAGGAINFNVTVPSGSGSSPNSGTAPMSFTSSGTTLATATGTLQIGVNGQATGKIALANEGDASAVGTLQAATLSGDRTWTLPNLTGTIALTDRQQIFTWDQIFQYPNVGNTTTAELTLSTGTVATSADPVQNSPGLCFFGNAWNTVGGDDWFGWEGLMTHSGAPTSAFWQWDEGTNTPFGSEVARLTSSGVFSPITGFQINHANAAIGHFLRGDGANFIDGTILPTDLPSIVTTTGETMIHITTDMATFPYPNNATWLVIPSSGSNTHFLIDRIVVGSQTATGVIGTPLFNIGVTGPNYTDFESGGYLPTTSGNYVIATPNLTAWGAGSAGAALAPANGTTPIVLRVAPTPGVTTWSVDFYIYGQYRP